MSVTIRPATDQDVSAIVAIEQQELSASHWKVDKYQSRLKDGCLLVAEREKRVCGFICAHAVLSDWDIENLVVAAAFRRRGIADQLLRALMEEPRNGPGTAWLLEVRESNEAARALYEKHGFLEVGRRRGYYREPSEDAVLYEHRVRIAE
jgi:ribosomal-protein-alanine N-acetyltransferase